MFVSAFTYKWRAMPRVLGLSLNRTALISNENYANVFWQTIGELLTEGYCGRGEGQLPPSSNPFDADKVDFVFNLSDDIAKDRSCLVLNIEVKPAVVTARRTEGFLNAALMSLPTCSDNAVVFNQLLERNDDALRDRLTYLRSIYAAAGNGFSGIFIRADLKVDEVTGDLVSLPNGYLILEDIFYYEKKTFREISFKDNLTVNEDGYRVMMPKTTPTQDKFTFMPLDEGHDLFVFMKEEIKRTCDQPRRFAPIPETS